MHRIISTFLLFLLLSSCSNKLNKYFSNTAPDEFAIIKNKPLVIPKNYNLPIPQAEHDSNENNNVSDETEKKPVVIKRPNKLQRIF